MKKLGLIKFFFFFLSFVLDLLPRQEAFQKLFKTQQNSLLLSMSSHACDGRKSFLLFCR